MENNTQNTQKVENSDELNEAFKNFAQKVSKHEEFLNKHFHQIIFALCPATGLLYELSTAIKKNDNADIELQFNRFTEAYNKIIKEIGTFDMLREKSIAELKGVTFSESLSNFLVNCIKDLEERVKEAK